MISIRKQLTRNILLVTLLVTSCAGIATFTMLKMALLRQFDAALLSKAQALSTFVEVEKNGEITIERDDINSLGFSADRSEHFFQLRRPDGSVLEQSPSLQKTKFPHVTQSGRNAIFFDIELPHDRDGRGVFFLFEPSLADELKSHPPPSLPMTLGVFSERESFDETLSILAAALGLSGSFLLLGIGLLVPRVLRREMRPLDDLTNQVAMVTSNSLSFRFPTKNMPLELNPIILRLNDLLARIEASFEHERQFGSNLAHELRTPLAELRSQAELSLKWPDERPLQADADTLAIAIRMERLVASLLALARTENGQMEVLNEPLDVSEIVEIAWRPFVQAASLKSLKFIFTNNYKPRICGDPNLIHCILNNLFDNAVQHTRREEAVTVEAQEREGIFRLNVSNSTQDLTQDDVDKMFDRFWRKETSRTGDEHSGLGLALARSYAEAMGWELKASLEGTLLTFCLCPQSVARGGGPEIKLKSCLPHNVG